MCSTLFAPRGLDGRGLQPAPSKKKQNHSCMHKYGVVSAGYMGIVNRGLGGLIDFFCRGGFAFLGHPGRFLVDSLPRCIEQMDPRVA